MASSWRMRTLFLRHCCAVSIGRLPEYTPGSGDRVAHQGHGGYRHVVADVYMPGDTGPTRNHTTLADDGAAGDGRATRDGGVLPDAYVVAHLYLVVQLDPVLDDGVLQGAAVDGGIGADLNVIADTHRTQLGDFHPAGLVTRDAEAIRTYDRTGVQQAALTQGHALAEGHGCHQATALTHTYAFHHHAIGTDAHLPADLGARLYHGTRPHPGIARDHRARIHMRGRMHACTGCRHGREQRSHTRI